MVADNPGAKFHHPQSWQRPGACGVHGKQNNMQDILGGNPPPSTWTAGAIPLTSKMKTCGFAITRLSCHT